ncbi:MAG TPA: pyridoxal-phosphate dependent enzyme, partial [Blastocatellia bacterium]
MTEGKKTAALEIGEQLNWNVPDKVFVGMGDGCIIGGLWKGFCDLKRLGMIERLPQMIGVQSENAPAIVDAANGDGLVREAAARTIADSINVGKPRDARKAIRAIRESGGCGVKVSDGEIVASIPEIARTTGVFVEPAAGASFAGFKRMYDTGAIKPDERVLLVLTGNGLKDADAARRVLKEPFRIRPDFDELARLIADLDKP